MNPLVSLFRCLGARSRRNRRTDRHTHIHTYIHTYIHTHTHEPKLVRNPRCACAPPRILLVVRMLYYCLSVHAHCAWARGGDVSRERWQEPPQSVAQSLLQATQHSNRLLNVWSSHQCLLRMRIPLVDLVQIFGRVSLR